MFAVADAVGVALAQVYTSYALFLLAGTFFGLHALFLALSVYWLRPACRFPLRPLQWVVDVAYALVNPLIYLVILVANGPSWQQFAGIRTPLSLAAWTLLPVVWGVRLMLPSHLLLRPAVRQAVRALLFAAVLVVVGHGLLDFRLFVVPLLREGTIRPGDLIRNFLSATVIPGSLASLYLIPVIRALSWLRALADKTGAAASQLLLVPPRAGFAIRAAVAAIALSTIASSAPRWSDRHANAVVLSHRDDIIRVAGDYGVDPRTLAAIMWVTQRDQLSPLRDAMERSIAAAWRWDEKSEFMLGAPLGISLGLMQVKPVTLQTAALLRDAARFPSWRWDFSQGEPPSDLWSALYQYRPEVARPDETWLRRIDAVDRFAPPFQVPATKPAVVAALLDDRRNIEASALILALCQLQWEYADPAWSIRHRPDILATLYQIGFERSRPHASPVSNRFGQRVKAVYEGEWMRTRF